MLLRVPVGYYSTPSTDCPAPESEDASTGMESRRKRKSEGTTPAQPKKRRSASGAAPSAPVKAEQSAAQAAYEDDDDLQVVKEVTAADREAAARAAAVAVDDVSVCPHAVGDSVLYTTRGGAVQRVTVCSVSTNVPLGEDPMVAVQMPDGTVRDTVLERLAPDPRADRSAAAAGANRELDAQTRADEALARRLQQEEADAQQRQAYTAAAQNPGAAQAAAQPAAAAQAGVPRLGAAALLETVRQSQAELLRVLEETQARNPALDPALIERLKQSLQGWGAPSARKRSASAASGAASAKRRRAAAAPRPRAGSSCTCSADTWHLCKAGHGNHTCICSADTWHLCKAGHGKHRCICSECYSCKKCRG